jgi:hypothetical protein
MLQYGKLVTELGVVPAYAEWDHRGLRPTESGLSKTHNMKWSELPEKFVAWVTTNKVAGFDEAIEIITASIVPGASQREDGDVVFSRLIKDIGAWTPARRRNTEETYKVELRKHLESLKYEFSSSRLDS